MSFKLPEFGNTGAFDTFNVPDADVEEAPFLSESQENEIKEQQAKKVERMTSPTDLEMAKIMGSTIKRIRTSPLTPHERPRSALSRAMETPEARKITKQQLLENELEAVRREREYRSASSNSSGSSRSSSRTIKPMKCVWCGGDIYSHYKDIPIHSSCYATYKLFFDHYNGEWNQKYNRDLTLKEAKKGYEKLRLREKEKLQEKQQRMEDKAKLRKLVEQGKGNMVRDMLFPPNPQFSGIPDSPSPEIPDSPDIYQNIDVQTGDHSELLDSDNEEPNDPQSNVVEVKKGDPMRYSAHKSRIAREIREREELKARREKHEKMIAQNKTKCKKKNKKGMCVISGGKKRRKTKKRRRKKRKTRRKRKSKKSKKRRRTRRK